MIRPTLCLLLLVFCGAGCSGREKPPAAPPDTTVAPPDTTVAPPDTAAAPPVAEVPEGPADAAPDVPVACRKEAFFTIDGAQVWRVAGEAAFFFEAGMTIDADGAPDAYHPDNTGTDHLANAGRPGNWWALATDTGQSSGRPVVQGPDDPNPGYYVSMTALEDRTKARTDPRRYVNSNVIPFVVLPGGNLGGARLGDFSVVVNTANDRRAFALFADIGPRTHLGEGSVALAEALGIRSNPRRGGTASGVRYLVWPGSGNGQPRTVEEIDAAAEALFARWGGPARLDACFAE